jgi:Phage integrase family
MGQQRAMLEVSLPLFSCVPASIVITLDTYAHAIPAMQEEAASLVAAMVSLSNRLSQSLWRLRRTGADDAPLFASQTGGYLDASNLAARVLKPAARRAGVPWAGFHTFSHTCATMLFRHGLNAKQAQMWLGHHSPAFTLSTYVHLLPDDLPDVDFLDGIAGAATLVGERGSGRTEAPVRGKTVQLALRPPLPLGSR